MLQMSVLLLLGMSASGQDIMGQVNNLYTDFLQAKFNDPSAFSKIAGTPYENPEFSNALVYMQGNDIALKARMRYNNFLGEMEFIREKDEQVLLLDNKELVDSILLNNITYRYLDYTKTEKEHLKGYFELIYQGGCGLYRRKPVEFKDEHVPHVGYEEYSPPEFVKKPEEFYAQFDNDPLVILPKSRRKIITIFREQGFDTGNVAKPGYDRESLSSFVKDCCGK